MNRVLIILIVFSFPILIRAQEPISKGIKRGDFIIKFSPLNIVDYNMPCLVFGVSYFISNKIAFQAKIGQKMDVYHFDDKYKFSGYKFLLEGQYYINRHIYISLEVGIHKNKFSDEMSYFPTVNDTIGIEDIYSVYDHRITIVPKSGYVLYITNHLLVDFYAGLGTQKHLRSVSDLEYDPSKGNIDVQDFYEWIGPTYNEINEYWAWLTFGVNISWKF